MHEYMETTKKNLYKALADFQQEVPVIHKGTSGYGYTYADLPTILEIINPLMKKNGLGFTQVFDHLENGSSLVTHIFHIESGETLSSELKIPTNVVLAKMNEFQVLGSGITYLRRYALSAILGLVTDKDTDAGETKPVIYTNKDVVKDPKDQFIKSLNQTEEI